MVKATWKDPDNSYDGEPSHGLMVVPVGDMNYRLYFVCSNTEEMAMLCATVVGFIIDNDLADLVKDAVRNTEGYTDVEPDTGEVH